jgi:hypothetical protein
MVMGEGLRPHGWAVSYRLAVVLTLAAARGRSLLREASGQRTGGGDHIHRPRRPERPRTCLHSQAQCAGRSGRC